MRSLTSLSLALVSISTLAVGCAAQDDAADDDLAGESDLDAEASKADGGTAADSYYTVEAIQALGNIGSHPPVKYIMRRANATKTLCGDGVRRDGCAISTLDFAAIRFAEQQERGLRGTLSQKINSGAVALMVRGKLQADKIVAKEVWQQDADVSTVPNGGAYGVAVKIKDSGIRCITAPCPTLREDKLNSATSTTLNSMVLPTDELTDRAWEAAYEVGDGTPGSANGVMIIGYKKTVHGERVRDANAVFFRIGK
jgi:hypothetical protein